MGKVIKAVAVGAIEVVTGVVLVATGNPVGVSLIVAGGLSMAQGVVGLLSSVEQKGVTGTLTSPLASLPIVYGKARLACRMADLRAVAPGNEYVYWVGAICHGSSDGGGIWSIDDIYFDGNRVWEFATGWTDSKYAGRVWFRVYYGTTEQAVDSELLARWPTEWPTTSQGRYVAYLSISFLYDQELFPQGMPNVTVDVQGGRCVDPRDIKTVSAATPSGLNLTLTVANHGLQQNDRVRIQRYTPDDPGIACEGFAKVVSVTDANTVVVSKTIVSGSYVANSCGVGKSTYSTNPIVCTFEYMTSPLYGPRGGVPWYEMDLAEWATYAAVCDTVTEYPDDIYWPADGPLFDCNGQVENSFLSDEIIKQLLSSCRGQLVFQNGKWRPFIRRAQTVSNPFVLNEDVIAGGFQLAWPGADSAPNSMRGRFINTQGFMPVQGLTKQAMPWFADEKIWPRPTTQPNPMLVDDNNVPSERQMEYPFTCNPYILEWIMMAECREARLGPLVAVTCFEAALACQVGDIVQVVHPTPGWTLASQAYFWVLALGLRADSLVEMVLMPYSSAAYALDALDAHDVPPLNTDLPNALEKPPAPTDVTLTCDATTALRLPGGQLQQRMKATWTAAANYPYVNHYEFWGYRNSEAPVLLGEALKDDTEFYFPVGHDELWSVQATTVSTLGGTSLPSTVATLSTPVLNVETTGDNVLVNGDGQQSAAGDDAAGWVQQQGAHLVVATDKAKYGDRCLKIDSTGVEQISYSYQTQAIAAAGEIWEAFGWVHVGGGLGGSGEGAGVTLDTVSPGSALIVMDGIGLYTDAGGNSGRCVYVPRTDTSNEWQFLRLIVRTQVAATLRCILSIGYATGCSGVAWFDGFVLRRLSPAIAKGGTKGEWLIDDNGSIYVPDTETVKVGEQGAPSVLTKTLRLPASLFIPTASGALYSLDGGEVLVATGSAGFGTLTASCPVVLPRGTTITGIRMKGWKNNTLDTVDVSLYESATPGSPTLKGTASLSVNDTWTVVENLSLDVPIGDQSYFLYASLSHQSAPADAKLAWAEVIYDMPSYDKGI